MWITIEVELNDPLLDLSRCTLNRTTDHVPYGDREVQLIQYDPDLDVRFGDYEIVNAEWEAIEAHLLKDEDFDR